MILSGFIYSSVEQLLGFWRRMSSYWWKRSLFLWKQFHCTNWVKKEKEKENINRAKPVPGTPGMKPLYSVRSTKHRQHPWKRGANNMQIKQSLQTYKCNKHKQSKFYKCSKLLPMTSSIPVAPHLPPCVQLEQQDATIQSGRVRPRACR